MILFPKCQAEKSLNSDVIELLVMQKEMIQNNWEIDRYGFIS